MISLAHNALSSFQRMRRSDNSIETFRIERSLAWEGWRFYDMGVVSLSFHARCYHKSEVLFLSF